MDLPAEYIWLLLTIPIIAFLYASVGHGGASGYIALMYLFNISDTSIKPIALMINLFVAGIAFYHYWRTGYFRFRIFLYFAVGSVPFSFLGGYFELSPLLYNSILALFLLFAILKLSGNLKVHLVSSNFNLSISRGIIMGIVIGFTSGLIGIGGGIILTPILVLLKWADIKEAAAISALFIWVNSLAGLSGQLAQGVTIPILAWPLVATAIVGGFFGSYLGANRIEPKVVKGLLITVLSVAFFKLIYSLWEMI